MSLNYKINLFIISFTPILFLLSAEALNFYEGPYPLMYSLFFVFVIMAISLVKNIRVKHLVFLASVLGIALPTVITKDPVIAGDLGRELFLAHTISEMSSAGNFAVKDQIAFTGYIFLSTTFHTVTSMNALAASKFLSLAIETVLAFYFFKLLTCIVHDESLSLGFALLLTSQYIFLYASQQGLRSLGWVLLLTIFLISLIDQRIRKLPLILIMCLSLAIFYYSFSMLGILYFILLAINYYRERQQKKLMGIGITYIMTALLWHFYFNIKFTNVFSSVVNEFIKSIKTSFNELYYPQPQEKIYVESFKHSLAWQMTIMINLAYVILIILAGLLALFTLVKNRSTLTYIERLLITSALFGAIVIIPGISNFVLRLTLGVNRLTLLSLVAALPYLAMKTRVSLTLNKHTKIYFNRKAVMSILFIIALFTYIANTGMLHFIMGEHAFTYLNREKSRRYVVWSNPFTDIVGYRWLVDHFSMYIKIIDPGYLGDLHLLYFSIITINNKSLHTFLILRNNVVPLHKLSDLNIFKNYVVPLRYANILSGKIFLKGWRLGLAQQLNIASFQKESNMLYNSGYFLILQET